MISQKHHKNLMLRGKGIIISLDLCLETKFNDNL